MNRRLWKTSTAWMAPILQMTNLVQNFGSAIGPQVTRPFLGHNTDISINVDVNVTIQAPTDDEGLEPVQVAYLVLGALNIGMAIICTITCVSFSIDTGQCNSVWDVLSQDGDRYEDVELIISKNSNASLHSASEPLEADTQPKQVEACSRPGCILLTIMFLMFFMNAGRVIILMVLLYTYLYEYLGWSVYASTLLLTMFHLVRFVIGIISVPVARWVSPTKLMIIDLASLLISAVLMLVALDETIGNDSLTAVGVIFAAVGDANMLPTLITLAEEATLVVAWVMALFMSASGVSIMIAGPVAGVLLNASVVSFPAIILALVSAGILLFILYLVTLRRLNSSGSCS